jgi:DNA-binding transcriptional ArsR family regulator
MVERYSAGLDQTYIALASPIRRSILERLGGGTARITDIAEPFDISLAAVSKHVQMLERAGLVKRRITGRDHWLALNPQPLTPAGEWIEGNRHFWEERLDKLDELLR